MRWDAAVRLSFVVLGEPRPKGSFRAFAAGVIANDNPNTTTWQSAVAGAAKVAMGCSAPIEGPVALQLRFYLQRPRTRRNPEATSKPDLDKLVRAAMDGLTQAALYRDDSQVTEVLAFKAFTGSVEDPNAPTELPRLEVVVL